MIERCLTANEWHNRRQEAAAAIMASARLALQQASPDSLAFLRRNIASMRRMADKLPLQAAERHRLMDWIEVNEREAVRLQAMLDGQLMLPL